MTRRSNLMPRRTVLAVMAAAALLVGGPGAYAQTNMRIATVNPPNNLSVQVAEEVGKRITELTDGRLTFQVFPSAQLGTTTDSLEQASQGQPVITFASASFMAQFGVPELAAVDGPFVVSNNEEAERLAFSDMMLGYYERLAEVSGIRVVALNWFDGARHLVGTAPYPHPSDLAGVKMRVPPVETWLKTFEPTGVIATTVEAAEAYTALSQGVVTAAESPLTGIVDKNWHEPAKHITLTGHFNLFIGWVMSEEVFRSLSEEDQTILMEQFRSGGRELTAKSEALQRDIRAEFESQGVQFHEADLDAYREATSSFWTSFPDWPDGLYGDIRAAATGQ